MEVYNQCHQGVVDRFPIHDHTPLLHTRLSHTRLLHTRLLHTRRLHISDTRISFTRDLTLRHWAEVRVAHSLALLSQLSMWRPPESTPESLHIHTPPTPFTPASITLRSA